MRKLKNRLLLFLGLWAGSLGAQNNDTTLLSSEEFLNLVKENHPLSLQARLIQERANAEKLKASGNFDPKLYSDNSQKYFDDKIYYRLQNSGLEIPAWFGLTAKAGYEINDGIFLNQQNTVPASGLWFADLSLTVGKGLFIDERRAMLKQARLLQQSADFEIQLALNQLYQDALEAYWNWYRTYSVNQVFTNAVDLARVRFEAVRENAFIGEEPFIDTLEAFIQYQTRLLSQQKAQIDYTNASRQLETYLWLDGQVPLELSAGTIPVYDDNMPDITLENDWLEQHPQLRFYDLKIERLQVEQRLNREQLKPQVDLQYKFLNQPVVNEEFFAEYSPDNYQWGLTASFPIFLRKERGEIRKTGVKLRDTEYEQQFKQRDIENKVSALQTELSLTLQQLGETRRMVNNYQRLLQAEIIKFENGESSLFLINQREIKYLESSEKQLELEAKLYQVLAKLQATAGILTR